MNQQQLAAVVCTQGAVRVAAGPGTGKTRVLTARIAHLVRELAVPPHRLLAVTFTNKAARELRERVTALIGAAEADSITMGTFHSLCLAMLRADVDKLPGELGYRRGFIVYDEHASLKLVQKLKEKAEGGRPTGAAQQTAEQRATNELSAGAVQSIISAAKNEGYDAATFRAQPPRRLVTMPTEQLALIGRVFGEYEATMRAENTVDFDDMLLLTTTLLRTSERTRRKYARHWEHVCVVREAWRCPKPPARSQAHARQQPARRPRPAPAQTLRLVTTGTRRRDGRVALARDSTITRRARARARARARSPPPSLDACHAW